jgi:hypothetical protein
MSSRQTKNEVTKLCKKYPFLNMRKAEFKTLIDDECEGLGEQKFVIKLLNQFTFLTQYSYNQKLSKILARIEETAKSVSGDVLVCALCIDRDPDSSQALIYALKTKAGRSPFQHQISFINNINKLKDALKAKTYKRVVYVDEFLGTGVTLISRIKEADKRILDAKLVPVPHSSIFIAGTKVGIENVVNSGFEVEAFYLLDKAIEDIFGKQSAERLLLDRLCSGFEQTFGHEELDILGWGKSESLYGREEGNCPNNVLPLFWWCNLKDDRTRATILNRYVWSL